MAPTTPTPLKPTAQHTPHIARYLDWLQSSRGLAFADYDALWRWSTSDLEGFWRSIWDYFALQSPTPHRTVLANDAMPGAAWFPGAQTNYARQVLRHVGAAHAAGCPAIVSDNERGQRRELSWPNLQRQVAALALHLRAQGVQRGDRVAAYLPNVPETMVAFLAVASIGAVWSVCAPDMGQAAVLDRFRQIEPVVLIACDGVTYGGRDLDRTQAVAELHAALPSVRHLLVLENLGGLPGVAGSHPLAAVLAREDAETAAFEPDWLPFDHPLWIVYSSGTTGLPKPIVHGHGGIVVVALALSTLHNDIGSSYQGQSERFLWYSTTGWIMWNCQVAGLLAGTTCCIFDGSPGGSREQPDWEVLWRFAESTGVTFFGAGAAYFANCMKAGVDLSRYPGLARLRALGTTGSPLAEDVQRWGTAQFQRIGVPDIWWCNVSGGTDFAGGFIGGLRTLPLVPGKMQCRMLGAAVEAWSDDGRPLVGEVGELVCTRPIPSMPLYFWNDAGNARYLASYFDTFPSVWRHGDWLRVDADGSCVIFGRSDATINRHGLRMGTSEIYSAIESLPEVLDAMVVDLEYLGRPSWMPLFVVLREGVLLDDALRGRLNDAVRHALSPRFVPDAIFQVPEIPRTLSGKKQELPIKKLLLGQSADKVLNRGTMANPACLAWYEQFARERAAQG
ncbi:acetoacetate--CoA ligase [Pseudorhodoferax sp. Leaf274]|uniref:acetoacetate--CoA ligase n=1 Tax=Pseudorhodoferax sp. Leaf274 TaxID=1736318 RepID=UPI000702EBF3|nr:acetoacetate--CoA ligase [Pseudorhodoferax sp. Leaf274]KQP49570.1 acetoacetyl-CoA synthetase [Pseudorhodoferax sp. Leaf274]